MRITGVDWWLDVRYHQKSFSGRVSIGVEDAHDPLVVDASHLEILAATLDGEPAPYHVDPAHGTIVFPGLSDRPHRLLIDYRGAANPDSLVGLYVSPSGPSYLLTTMLFPTGSRRLLPSFEHPTVKTVYRLTLTIDDDVKAIFNTAARTERRTEGRQVLEFEPTPPMSVYLLYLCVGPFETLTFPGHPWSVTVAASPGRASAGRYCGERATELLAAYAEYYDAPYPLSKLDLVALQNFWAGAMENWGAIAFRESMVLVDPTTSVRTRRFILLTLAHEVAHQWFGNLVTPAWWDDFWLNESFATFVSHRIISRRYPEEDPWASFLIGQVARAFKEDSLPSTHPIRVPVDSPEALGEIADAVTYGKGAAVLRMIEAYIGEEAFRRGVSDYLATHRYGNARADDLWTALSEVSDRPVMRVMSEWITRPGYPVLHIRWSAGKLTLRQEQFRADGGASPGSWPIPLRLASPEGETTTLFEGSELSLAMISPEGLQVDPGRTAFVRLHYDDSLFDRILAGFSSMPRIDQWGVVVDTHAFVYAGITPLAAFLKLVRAASPLKEDLPVRAISSSLSDLHRPLYDVPEFLAASSQFLRAQLQRIGLDPRSGEPDSACLLRELMTAALVEMDRDFARELAARFGDLDRLSAELRWPVAIAYAKVGGEGAFDALVSRLKSTTQDDERSKMVGALAAFDEPDLIRRVLDLIPSGVVTPSRTLDLLLAISVNPMAGGELFDWYRIHAKDLANKWAGTPLLSGFLRYGLPGMGLDRAEVVERYFAEHVPPEAILAVQQGLDTLRLVMRLRMKSRGP